MNTKKLRTVSVVEAVAERVAEDIFSGSYAQGDTLVESQLAETYEVPRPTVRAALAILMQDGVLRREPNRSVYIPKFSSADIIDLYAMRRVLEVEAVRRLASDQNQASLREAGAAVRMMEVLDDNEAWEEVLRCDFEFHRALVRATESPRLVKCYRSISAEMRLALTFFRSQKFTTDYIAQEHRQLLNAVKSNDTNAAVQACRTHIDDSEAFILERIVALQER